MISPRDDLPHPVPPQAFMTWKENWVFPAVDPRNRTACLFHFSLRPAVGEGIFTAKFCVDGEEYRYVGRSSIPSDIQTMSPVENERVRFEVVKPGERFALKYLVPSWMPRSNTQPASHLSTSPMDPWLRASRSLATSAERCFRSITMNRR